MGKVNRKYKTFSGYDSPSIENV